MMENISEEKLDDVGGMHFHQKSVVSLPFLIISAGVEVENDENNKNISLGEKDTTSANTKVFLWQYMIM